MTSRAADSVVTEVIVPVTVEDLPQTPDAIVEQGSTVNPPGIDGARRQTATIEDGAVPLAGAPKTSDDNNIEMYIMLFAVSAVLFTGLLIIGCRSRKRKGTASATKGGAKE